MVQESIEPEAAHPTSDTSRRTFLKGAIAATAALSGAGMLKSSAFAQTAADNPTQIFSIAATAERLAVTFYGNGVKNAAALGLSAADLDSVKGFLIEEQIHELFFEAQGGVALTSTFSFPQGAATFTDLSKFIATQQQLEGAFDSAFIAAAYEFAQMNNPAVARIAVQIAMIEEGHRTVGRAIGGLDPAEDNAFAPQTVATVGAAPAVLQAAGYLSPTTGNTYTYAPIDLTDPAYAPVAAKLMYKQPFVATASSTPTSATPYHPGKKSGDRAHHHPRHLKLKK